MGDMDADLTPSPAKGQIKSKERVSKHGEVFTAEREVNAMLDLVKQETERIESRFLEPRSCSMRKMPYGQLAASMA